MIKLFSILLLIGFYSTGKAQIPVPIVPQIVTDPTAYAHLLDNLAEAKKQVDYLKEAQNLVAKVNGAVREVFLMQQVIDNQVFISRQIKETYKQLETSKVFTPAELQKMLYQLTLFITASQQTIALANKIVQDGLFKMGDYERIAFLLQLKKEMDDTRALVSAMRATYMQAMQIRLMKRVFTEKDRNGN